MPAGLAAQQDLLRRLLGEVGGQLGEEQREALPSAMGRFVISDLRAAISDSRAAME